MTLMLKPGSCACWVTQLMPAMTWVTSTEPSNAPAFTLISRASGAMPVKWEAAARRCRRGALPPRRAPR